MVFKGKLSRACSMAKILYFSLCNSSRAFCVSSKYIHSTEFSAPSAVLCNSALGGVLVIPHK